VDGSWTCGECGWTNQGGRFCFECGRDGDPDPVAHERAAPQAAADRRRLRLGLVAGAVALVVAVVAITAILLSGGDGSRTTADAARPVARSGLTRAQTVDELMQIVVASGAGLDAARRGQWAQAARNRTRLVRRLDALGTRTHEVAAARTALARALEASGRANTKSLACKDARSVSACAAPAHQRATKLKERFRRAFNEILAADGRDPVARGSF
jgi:hypothetical protein